MCLKEIDWHYFFYKDTLLKEFKMEFWALIIVFFLVCSPCPLLHSTFFQMCMKTEQKYH